MENRKQIEVIRDVMIDRACFQYEDKVNKKNLEATLKELKDDDVIIGLVNRHGFREPGFGSMDDEPVYYNHWALVVKNHRLETDEEFFKRMKEEENQRKINELRERTEYLRLKAKFEPNE